jgi:hypothetical protein
MTRDEWPGQPPHVANPQQLQAAGGGAAEFPPSAGQGGNVKEGDLPLVRGGKLPKEAPRWLAEVEKHFPGTTRDIIVIRQKPISRSTRGGEIGNSTQREKV